VASLNKQNLAQEIETRTNSNVTSNRYCLNKQNLAQEIETGCLPAIIIIIMMLEQTESRSRD